MQMTPKPFRYPSLLLFMLLLIVIRGLAPLKAGAQSSPAGGNWNESDGVDDYAQAPDSNSLDVGIFTSEDITVEAWIYLRSAPSSGKVAPIIVKKADFITGLVFPEEAAYQLYIKDDLKLNFSVTRGEQGFSTVTNTIQPPPGHEIQLNQWTHLVGAYQNSSTRTISIAVNGNWFKSTSVGIITSPLHNSSQALTIAGEPSQGFFFDGRIDEVRISDNIRYTSNFTPPSGPFTPDSNTRALWHFNELMGSTVFADSSSNNNTLTGFNGDQSLPVALSSFTATVGGDGILLKWRTESETNNLGFHVYRSKTKDGEYVRITPTLIKGHGTDAIPHDYSFLDETAEPEKTYYYYIEDTDFSGKTNQSHLIKVGAPTSKGRLTTPWGALKSR
ncbi:hypothetical protein HYR99_28485 [Candidatus Poribacteria bacterium]|nr:hypothetical protein [Candidatus Poribacteria bacterium]